MIDKFFRDLPEEIFNYTESLQKESFVKYLPAKTGVTDIGKSIELGFSCYALKIYYMTSNWDILATEKKDEWHDFLNSFQSVNKNFPNNSYIDESLVSSLSEVGIIENFKDLTKSTLTKLNVKQFDSRLVKIKKAVNAETKQTISTLIEVGRKSKDHVEFPYENKEELLHYLDNLNWNTPWTSGAQFSSLCVYSKLNNNLHKEELYNFLYNLNNQNTGSYHLEHLNNEREIINGAMKVISGLDWLEMPIHKPKELIDFCLSNIPVSEGCDIVDFVYVLYMCSKQLNYRKKEINNLFLEILSQLKKLYNKEDNAFSYFVNKSQTHYYGVKITNGEDTADIHGSLLCLWAVLMILDNLEEKPDNCRIIKP